MVPSICKMKFLNYSETILTIEFYKFTIFKGLLWFILNEFKFNTFNFEFLIVDSIENMDKALILQAFFITFDDRIKCFLFIGKFVANLAPIFYLRPKKTKKFLAVTEVF